MADGANRFCTSCGASLQPIAAVNPAAVPAGPTLESRSGRGSRWVAWLAVALVAAVAGTAAFLVVRSRSSLPTTAGPAPEQLGADPSGAAGAEVPTPTATPAPDRAFESEACEGMLRAGPVLGDYIVIWESRPTALWQKYYTIDEACERARELYGDRPDLALLNGAEYRDKNVNRRGDALWIAWSGPFRTSAQANRVMDAYGGGNVRRIQRCSRPDEFAC